MKSFGTLTSWLVLPLDIDPDCDREAMFIEAQGLATRLNVNVRFEVDGMTCTLKPNSPYGEPYRQYQRAQRKQLADGSSQ